MHGSPTAIGRAVPDAQPGEAIAEDDYLRLVLREPERHWERAGGALREKVTVAADHFDVMSALGKQLLVQLDVVRFRVRINGSRLRLPNGSYYVPDLFVVPTARVQPFKGRPGIAESFADAVPLVVEIWSPSTGGYDVAAKLPAYQARGDAEIWLLHPYGRTLTVWRRQPDASYVEVSYDGGVVPVAALPGVMVDLDTLFA